MSGDIFGLGLLTVLACLLVAAAVTDIQSRIISNRLNLAIALLAPLYWWSCALPLWPGVALQVALGLAVFAVFAGLFALGMMGGGDVKMLAALALWFPWGALLFLLVVMALLGAVVTIVTLVHHRVAHRPGTPEVPYGVAISLAALWVIGEPYFNHFT